MVETNAEGGQDLEPVGAEPVSAEPAEPDPGDVAGPGPEPQASVEAAAPVRRRWTRRRFLALGGVAALGAGIWWRASGYAFQRRLSGLRALSPTAGAIVAAIADAALPPGADRRPATLAGHVREVDRFLSGVPEATVRELTAAIYGVEHLTLPLGGALRRFSRLSRPARERVLRAWQTSRVGLLRAGFRGLISLVFLAYYRDDAAFETIGYPGPIVRDGQVGAAVRRRYAALRAPAGSTPGAGWNTEKSSRGPARRP